MPGLSETFGSNVHVAVPEDPPGPQARPADDRSPPVNLAIAATAFGVVFPAELPDKTAVASLVLGSRFRPAFAYPGVAAAFAVHVVLAVLAGSVLGLLPSRPLQAVAAVLFAAAGVLLLRQRRAKEEEQPDVGTGDSGFWRAAGTSFIIILVAEFGDLTQIATATLAARYHDPVSVGIGALLALWAVAILAIVSGRELLRVMPLQWVSRAAAAVMLALAGFSLAAAVS
jgi:Ca2+/H+ antiporter, TMEM165/GDT1 family